MSYLIHNDTYIIASGFNSERGAKTSLTRRWKKRYPKAEVCSREHFDNHIDHMVETVNIMTGGKCMIRASEKGGCCDPGTERYHCM